MFDFGGYLVVVGFVTVALWLLIGAARLYHCWHASQQRTAGLRQQKADMAKTLLQRIEEIMQIETEVKEAGQRAATLDMATDTRAKQLETLVPPPPPSIYVTSEFPPSSRDKPWQALLRRTMSAKSRRADEPAERYVLVWASDHSGAQGRAQNALSNFPGFAIDGVLRFE